MSTNHDLNVNFLGIELCSPVIVGSCPLTTEPETVRHLVDAGAGAVVLPSIFPQQFTHAAASQSVGREDGSLSKAGNTSFDKYLNTIDRLKALQRCPVFASIGADSTGDWIDRAARLQGAGADALELNWQSPIYESIQSAQQIEDRLCDLVGKLSESVTIPIAVKLSQRFTSLASIARRIESVGAAGLVLFTHSPHWDVSIDRMEWTVRWELSPIGSLAGILEGIVRTRAGGLQIPIAASGGVRCGEDAIKAMIAGASVVTVASELYRGGPDAIGKIMAGISQYLSRSQYDSLQALQASRPPIPQDAALLLPPEYADPLTRSTHGDDSSAIARAETGNGFGHSQEVER